VPGRSNFGTQFNWSYLMTNAKYAAQVGREAVLSLLSDAEAARVSTAEGTADLHNEEEFVDLEHLERGVQQAASATQVTVGTIIPRNSVSNATWSKIVARLMP
jgi:hypothetical protein